MGTSTTGYQAVCCAIIFVVIFAVVDKQQARAAETAEVCDLYFTENVTLRDIPVARSIEQQSKGLSEQSEAGQGMLFTWDKSEPRAVWMHNTQFDLTVGFISDDGTLFAIEDMKAKTDKYHLSMKPAKYILELPKGQFKKKGLHEGSRLTNRVCKKITLYKQIDYVIVSKILGSRAG